MNDDAAKKPNPGSTEAIDQGCTCAIIDNHYGKGFRFGGADSCFYIAADCPLHGNAVGGAETGEAGGPQAPRSGET